ncbi:CobW family GTP-binding protein [Alkalimarinus alittae]|uniref:GTP-binding protein n=1 Tax=Alkalimarinus alittae TaxID=2961619 RepID=A0ABY6MZS7_9ALTE|nr:GTP-binding protein [Alkalimarinus alittae]UZE95290.1 GTP-binding protein [Alkalimarinus alittae]
MKKISTNIITGFLGVGKTTAILELLKTKPKDEVWAVLVNEFGEVGIDGALLSNNGAFIKEVPGGCMCCVAGLPMQIGLNLLISKAKPDRLLIEPTGLGHPKQIIETLTNEHYHDLLDLRSVITLVDPRNLNNARYLDNENFNDQISVADVVVANKTDRCTEAEKPLFEAYLSGQLPTKQATGWVSQGKLEPQWLDYKHNKASISHSHQHSKSDLPSSLMTLEEGEAFTRKENQGQGFYSCGWLFNSKTVFDHPTLNQYFTGLAADRLKAIVKTTNGVYAFNSVAGVLSTHRLIDSADSRIEIINNKKLAWDNIEKHFIQASIN